MPSVSENNPKLVCQYHSDSLISHDPAKEIPWQPVQQPAHQASFLELGPETENRDDLLCTRHLQSSERGRQTELPRAETELEAK